MTLSVLPLALLQLTRARLLALTSAREVRQAAADLMSDADREVTLAPTDAVSLFELGAVVARTAGDEDLSRFLLSGRLPELVVLSPRQMEGVRGGRLKLTVARGIAPITILAPWADEHGGRSR
jgi:hypothetical protein